MRSEFILSALAFYLSACKTSQPVTGLFGVDIENSNIGSMEVQKASIEALHLVPDTMIPKGVLATLESVNLKTVVDLYKIIRSINLRESLSGLEGRNQEITLVLLSAYPHYKNIFIDQLKDECGNDREEEGTQGLPEDLRAIPCSPFTSDELNSILTSGKAPFVDFVDFPLAAALTPGAPPAGNYYIQDWLEIGAARVRKSNGQTLWAHGLLELHQPLGIDPATGNPWTFPTKSIAEILRIPYLPVEMSSFAANSTRGGNLEALPNGKMLFVETLKTADPLVYDHLLKLGNEENVGVPAFTELEHVDEGFAFVPINDSCGYGLVRASPLLAINLLLNSADDALQGRGVGFNILELRDVVSAMLVRKMKAANYSIDDFDIKLAPNNSLGRRVAFWLQSEIALNEGEARLRKNLNCLKKTAYVPTLPSQMKLGETSVESGVEIGNPSNLLVLRDHIVVPMPKRASRVYPFSPSPGSRPIIQPFFDRTIEELVKLSGDRSKVHMIDTAVLTAGGGAIHCGTKPIRELNMPMFPTEFVRTQTWQSR